MSWGWKKSERRQRKANVNSLWEDKPAQSLSVAMQRLEPAPHPYLKQSTYSVPFFGTQRQEKTLQTHNLYSANAVFVFYKGHSSRNSQLCATASSISQDQDLQEVQAHSRKQEQIPGAILFFITGSVNHEIKPWHHLCLKKQTGPGKGFQTLLCIDRNKLQVPVSVCTPITMQPVNAVLLQM